jgi:lysyl-tRNA synthetase class 2
MEVETPVLSSSGTTDPNIHSLSTRVAGFSAPLYLHTSPEFPMKRLLAAGSGDIYQLARVFRDGESGRRHNPEFTMLEYYRLGMDHHELMDDVANLLGELLEGVPGANAPTRVSYREAYKQAAGLDPFTAGASEIMAALAEHNVPLPAQTLARGQLTDLLMGAVVAPGLGRQKPCFVYDYPADQAALARIRDEDPPVAERFELFFHGMELANGFHELLDADEQASRFEQDNRQRLSEGLPAVPPDLRMLQALRQGMPACAGVAVGFDRLLMLASDASTLSAVLAFDIMRA